MSSTVGEAASAAGAEARNRYGNLSSEQQSTLDRAATAQGVSVLQLMEIAGWQVARWLSATTDGQRDLVLVVAGSGNNGGDGLVAARHLHTWGFPVRVALVAEPDRLGELPALHLGALRTMGVPVTAHPDGDLPSELLDAAATVVDALLGTGARGDPRPPLARAISRLPAGRTVAVDIPSGLDATTGTPGTPTVHALRTCALTAMKAGLWTAEGRRHAGEITVADIGMPTAAWAAAGLAPPTLVRGGELLTIPTDTVGAAGIDAAMTGTEPPV
ncbi:MAG: NAD(P)H-hydrate epimerase [Candidatus Dormibacteria bacterium]|jgi:NAD(P)H-hydrate epimerase